MYSVSSGAPNAAPVLVIGGSLVGLSAAVFLAWRGVPVIVVERHLGSSPHPRAIGFTSRTLELFRSVGLGARIPQVPRGMRLRRHRVDSLAGTWREELHWSPEPAAAESGGKRAVLTDFTPCTGAALAQDRLEPILRDHARALGADLRLGSEVVSFVQDAEGVTANVRDPDGQTYALRAAYVVAADGHRSPTREALGIGRSGRGHMRTSRSVLFRAPLDEYLASGVGQFVIDDVGFLTTYADGRWILFFGDDQERDEPALRAAIARAIGRDDVPVEILTTGRWHISALIADRFADGRVFLAGDAAHTLPPNRGGYGANTGIEDAHNLAWKLAAVLAGASTPALLDTYDAERRPIAWLRHQQIFAREDFAAMSAGVAKDTPILDDIAIELGQLYRSAAIADASPALPPAQRPDRWAGQPGTRAPHLWLAGQRSLLDELGRDWSVIADDGAWRAAAATASAQLRIPLHVLQLGVELAPATGDVSELRTSLALAGGAALIRPDGYIAWRATERVADPAAALCAAMARAAAATA